MKTEHKNILAVGAHHDDIELGCGGTLAKLSLQGHKVSVMILTNSRVDFRQKNIVRTREQAEKEFLQSMKILGLENQKRYGTSLVADNGELVYSRRLMQEIEYTVFDNKIDTLFCHWRGDMNTDHAEAAKLCVTAGRHVPTILQFRSNWYQPDRAFNGIAYSNISGEPFAWKKKALACYKTEIKNRGQNWIDSFVKRDEINGLAIGVQAAETFEPVRLVV